MRNWATMSDAEGAYLEAFEAENNDDNNDFADALDQEARDGSGETRYDYMRDLRSGIYRK